MSERKYYVFCDDKCLFEGMTKEQIIAAIAEATGSTPTSIDDAFITKIKEQNGNRAVKIWTGTQAQYNALTPATDTLYIITDSNPLETLNATVTNLQTQLNTHTGKIKKLLYDGTAEVGDSLSIPSVSDYDVFLIYLNNTITNSPILITKGADNLSRTHLDGVGFAMNTSDNTNIYQKVSVIGTGTDFTVSVAQWSATADFETTGTLKVKKIYGLY